MKKREFVQAATISFMPALQWDIDKSISFAERLWDRLEARGYGLPKENEPHAIKNAYDKLSVLQKAQFDLFWIAFDYKKSRDTAASAWLKLGKLEQPELDKLIAAAGYEAIKRKNLPEGAVPKMAQGWISERRWLDGDKTGTEHIKKQQDDKKMQFSLLCGDLAHARRMAAQTGDDFWEKEAQKITDKLDTLRRDA